MEKNCYNAANVNSPHFHPSCRSWSSQFFNHHLPFQFQAFYVKHNPLKSSSNDPSFRSKPLSFMTHSQPLTRNPKSQIHFRYLMTNKKVVPSRPEVAGARDPLGVRARARDDRRLADHRIRSGTRSLQETRRLQATRRVLGHLHDRGREKTSQTRTENQGQKVSLGLWGLL